MKLTKKILIISLVALSFFTTITPSFNQPNSKITFADNDSDYEEKSQPKNIKPHFINIITTI